MMIDVSEPGQSCTALDRRVVLVRRCEGDTLCREGCGYRGEEQLAAVYVLCWGPNRKGGQGGSAQSAGVSADLWTHTHFIRA